KLPPERNTPISWRPAVTMRRSPSLISDALATNHSAMLLPPLRGGDCDKRLPPPQLQASRILDVRSCVARRTRLRCLFLCGKLRARSLEERRTIGLGAHVGGEARAQLVRRAGVGCRLLDQHLGDRTDVPGEQRTHRLEFLAAGREDRRAFGRADAD